MLVRNAVSSKIVHKLVKAIKIVEVNVALLDIAVQSICVQQVVKLSVTIAIRMVNARVTSVP